VISYISNINGEIKRQIKAKIKERMVRLVDRVGIEILKEALL
jgi:hypothetical protein